MHSEKADCVILHEMIHLHESVLQNVVPFFHDAVLWNLYQSLCNDVKNLEEIVNIHGSLDNQLIMYYQGGEHDILFLLKSFDLDRRLGKPFGTIFGYDMADKVKQIQSTSE